VDTGPWLRPVQYERKARPAGNAGVKGKIQKAKFKKAWMLVWLISRGKESRVKSQESRRERFGLIDKK